MSSFKITALHKKSGEVHEVWCMDDYFGRHIYGYIPNIQGGKAMREAGFYSAYTPAEAPSDDQKGKEHE